MFCVRATGLYLGRSDSSAAALPPLRYKSGPRFRSGRAHRCLHGALKYRWHLLVETGALRNSEIAADDTAPPSLREKGSWPSRRARGTSSTAGRRRTPRPPNNCGKRSARRGPTRCLAMRVCLAIALAIALHLLRACIYTHAHVKRVICLVSQARLRICRAWQPVQADRALDRLAEPAPLRASPAEW